MRLFLGVDGGLSSTVALIGDETGRVVGVGRGPACLQEGAIGKAVNAAGASGRSFAAACFGLSGTWPERRSSNPETGGDPAATGSVVPIGFRENGGPDGREATLRELVKADRYIVTHDASIALTGALAGEPGIIVIAGTGSMAFGRNRTGRSARAGGWGYAFGDEGGAFDLVRHALRGALRQEEGWGPPTALRELLLAACGAPDANDLMHRFYTPEWPRERVAALAPLLDQAAEGGDLVAQEILKGAAQALATIAGVVRGRLFEEGETAVVSYTGGVFRSGVVLERFRMLVELGDGTQLQAPRYGPAAGALIQAYRAAGVEVLPKDVPLEKYSGEKQ